MNEIIASIALLGIGGLFVYLALDAVRSSK